VVGFVSVRSRRGDSISGIVTLHDLQGVRKRTRTLRRLHYIVSTPYRIICFVVQKPASGRCCTLSSDCDRPGKAVLPASSPHHLLITDRVIPADKAGRLRASRPWFEGCGNGPIEGRTSTSDVDGSMSHYRQAQKCCMGFQKARLGTIGVLTRAKARFDTSGLQYQPVRRRSCMNGEMSLANAKCISMKPKRGEILASSIDSEPCSHPDAAVRRRSRGCPGRVMQRGRGSHAVPACTGHCEGWRCNDRAAMPLAGRRVALNMRPSAAANCARRVVVVEAFSASDARNPFRLNLAATEAHQPHSGPHAALHRSSRSPIPAISPTLHHRRRPVCKSPSFDAFSSTLTRAA
jgi:hypothetical protein